MYNCAIYGVLSFFFSSKINYIKALSYGINIYIVLQENSWQSIFIWVIRVIKVLLGCRLYQLALYLSIRLGENTRSRFHRIFLTYSCNLGKLPSNLEDLVCLYIFFFLLFTGIFNFTSTHGYLNLPLFSNLRLAELGDEDSRIASCS